MKENFKIYVDTTKPSIKLKFSINYLKPSESINWATNEKRPTGYRVSAVPVERSADGRIESFTAFTGFGDTLLACLRRSNKRYEEAQDILIKNLPQYIKWFENKGYELTPEAKEQVLEQSKTIQI